ncbi:MAG: MmgE/PrpD family protein [Candidatus Nezhaarchaeales archaeon]
MGVTEDLADFIVSVGYEDLPNEVVERAKLCILDWLGAALAGSLEPPANIVTSIIKEAGGREESTIIGMGVKTFCVNAALANGVLGHTVELDDVHEEAIIHPAAPVLPAALAVAERVNASGRDLIVSVVLGYDVEIRIGKAVNPSHYRFWHPTGTCGTFGATAAAGKILGLNGEEMVHALGIAGTQAAGLIEVFGTMSKPLNPGRAAENGVWAALLAQKGFTSTRRILEAERGYCRATSKDFDPGKITEKLGEKFEIVNNVFKVHASCGHTHGAIDAALLLSKEYNVKPEDIERVVVKTYPIAVDVVGRNYEPKTASEAKFSLPYCLAVTLVYGRVGLTEFSKEKLNDPKVRELSRKVTVTTDPEYVNVRLGSAKVVLYTIDGGRFECRVDTPKGYPENPVTEADLERKFIELASLVLPGERVRRIIEAVKGLEGLERITALTDLLR